jgi:type III pantothenate kinase
MNMLLAIDIGNSNIAAGLWNGSAWVEHWRFSSQARRTADEYAGLFRSAFQAAGFDPASLRGIAISAVVPELEDDFEQLGQRLFGRAPFILKPWHTGGLRLAIDNPNEIGTDLLANAVAGFEKYRGACIVVDFGTALSFTAVDSAGVLQGVAIAPGLGTAARALAGETARLPHIRLEAPATAIGKNTIHAIQSGIVRGYAGLVSSLTADMRRELGGAARVVFTGGLARTLDGFCDCAHEIDAWLTLDGIRLIASRHAAS